MILRKPYAILIKNFRLIHIIMALFMGYLFYRTNAILSFFNDYLGSVATTINPEITASLFNSYIVISLLLVVIGSVIIMVLLSFKEKPIKFYMYNIITCIILAIYYYICFTVIKSLELNLVDVKTLKLLHDIALPALFMQGIGIVIVIFRATGFDIKSFDFKKDLEDLNVEAKDNEEFEVNVEFDSDKFRRKLNKSLRHAKYIYFENKLLINVFMAIAIVFLGILIYLNNTVYNAVIPLNKTFRTNNFNFNFVDSYVTKYDYKGVELKEGYELAVVRFKVRSTSGNSKIGMGSFYLDLNGYKYYHNLNYKDEAFDFGETFNNQTITNEFKEYVLLFEIPISRENGNMILKYTDTNRRVIDIKVIANSLNKEEEMDTVDYPYTIDFKKSILNNSNLQITNYEIASSFKIDYQTCSGNVCTDYYEYLKPSTDNNAKYLLKLDGIVNIDEELNISKINNLYKFIKYFGKIKYLDNDAYKTMNINIKEVTPRKTKTNSTYIELTEEAANASKLIIEFNIRGKLYTYNVK